MIDLKKVLQNNPNCLSTRASFKSVLSDVYPNEKRLINILTIMYESGMVNAIKKHTTIGSAEFNRLLTRLENEYGISPQYSAEAVQIWSQAYSIPTNNTTPVATPIIPSPSQIQRALINNNSFSEQISVDLRYFDYEEETGMITDYWGKPVQCPELQRYTKRGLRIVSYNGFETERIVVPGEIDGRPVISIGEKVFMNVAVSEVVLPNTLKAILKQAFDGCEKLSSVSLPDGITYIGSGCFQNSGLEKFLCPQSVTVIPNSCFYCCESLSEITLPESLMELEDACFENTAIKVIIIPQNVKRMHGETFGRSDWEIFAKHKHKIACVFLGKDTDIFDTDIFTTITGKSILSRVALIYCLPGSKIQKIAREHSIPIKPLGEFRLEDYQ